MKSFLTILFFCLLTNIRSQDFSDLVFDNDTIVGLKYVDCGSFDGHHTFQIDSKDDSLTCTLTNHYPLEKSKKALCVQRNLYGDTLAIGMTIEREEKVKFSVFKKPLMRKSFVTYYDKIGEWFYYDHEGALIKKEFY